MIAFGSANQALTVNSAANGLEWASSGSLTSKYDATVAPGLSNDTSEGYSVGSIWVDVSADQFYICVDASSGAAIWSSGGGSGSSTSNKLDGTRAPIVTDDSSSGYEVGSTWVDVTNDNFYICVDSSVGAAIWSGGAEISFEYAVLYNNTQQVITNMSIPEAIQFQVSTGSGISYNNSTYKFTLTANKVYDIQTNFIMYFTTASDWIKFGLYDASLNKMSKNFIHRKNAALAIKFFIEKDFNFTDCEIFNCSEDSANSSISNKKIKSLGFSFQQYN